jgi:hypothetical protein
MQQTPGVRLQEFFNQLRGITLELGAGAIPAFRAFVAPIEAAIRWFDELNPRTQRFIGHAIALAGILGLLVGTFLAVAGGLARIAAMAGMALRFMGGSGLAGEAGLINVRFALLFGTVGLLVLAFTKFHSQTMGVISALGGLQNTLAVVVSLFAAWKLASYAIMIGRLAAEVVGLATSVTEIGTAAKRATLETIGLRTALMGIAGLVITATILIVSRKQVSAAGRHLLGDEINKEIDAITAQPSPLSFGQKLGNWLFESPTTATKNLFESFLPGRGWDAGWKLAEEQQKTGIGRISVAYKSFLSALGRPVGTPAALKQFLDLLSQRGLGKSSSLVDIEQFITNIRRASFGVQNVHGLGNQMAYLRKSLFALAHEDPFRDMNNRLVQAHMNTLGLASGLKDIQKINQDIGKSAVQMGVVSTPAFKQLFANLVQAKMALKGHEGNVQLQRNVINAQTALQANVSKQQSQAASRAATAQADAVGKITPAWQAATQQGIIATAQYVRLYNAVNRAQAAMTKDPTIANQRAYIAANNALQRYVNNATQANQQVAQSAKATFQDVVNSVTNMYQQLLQQNQTAFGTLFQGPFIQSPQMQNFAQWGGRLTGQDLTKDLQSQIGQFRNFNRLLTQLQRRGAPQELINQLRALGPQAIQQIRALTQMSGPELRRYFNLFQEGQKAIHQQTMRQLNRQLRDYLKYGRNIALQMIAGIRQEAPGITRAIERAVRRAFGNMGGNANGGGGGQTGNNATNTVTHQHRHQHQHHHRQIQQTVQEHHRHMQTQTRVAQHRDDMQRVTVMFPNRTIRTFETKHIQDIQGRVHVINPIRHVRATIDSPRQPWRVRLENPGRHKVLQGEMHQHDHYHVEAPKGSNVDTQIRHAAFRNRNRHRRNRFHGDRYGG